MEDGDSAEEIINLSESSESESGEKRSWRDNSKKKNDQRCRLSTKRSPESKKTSKTESGICPDAIKTFKIIQCTACHNQINVYKSGTACRHPVLKVLICRRCYEWYTSADIDQGSDGIDEQCRWCGEGGSVVLCGEGCHNVFCKTCIRQNLGRAELTSACESNDWQCYVCHPAPLSDLRQYCSDLLAVVENLVISSDNPAGAGSSATPSRRRVCNNAADDFDEEDFDDMDEETADNFLKELLEEVESIKDSIVTSRQKFIKTEDDSVTSSNVGEVLRGCVTRCRGITGIIRRHSKKNSTRKLDRERDSGKSGVKSRVRNGVDKTRGDSGSDAGKKPRKIPADKPSRERRTRQSNREGSSETMEHSETDTKSETVSERKSGKGKERESDKKKKGSSEVADMVTPDDDDSADVGPEPDKISVLPSDSDVSIEAKAGKSKLSLKEPRIMLRRDDCAKILDGRTKINSSPVGKKSEKEASGSPSKKKASNSDVDMESESETESKTKSRTKPKATNESESKLISEEVKSTREDMMAQRMLHKSFQEDDDDDDDEDDDDDDVKIKKDKGKSKTKRNAADDSDDDAESADDIGKKSKNAADASDDSDDSDDTDDDAESADDIGTSDEEYNPRSDYKDMKKESIKEKQTAAKKTQSRTARRRLNELKEKMEKKRRKAKKEAERLKNKNKKSKDSDSEDSDDNDKKKKKKEAKKENERDVKRKKNKSESENSENDDDDEKGKKKKKKQDDDSDSEDVSERKNKNKKNKNDEEETTKDSKSKKKATRKPMKGRKVCGKVESSDEDDGSEKKESDGKRKSVSWKVDGKEEEDAADEGKAKKSGDKNNDTADEGEGSNEAEAGPSKKSVEKEGKAKTKNKDDKVNDDNYSNDDKPDDKADDDDSDDVGNENDSDAVSSSTTIKRKTVKSANKNNDDTKETENQGRAKSTKGSKVTGDKNGAESDEELENEIKNLEKSPKIKKNKNSDVGDDGEGGMELEEGELEEGELEEGEIRMGGEEEEESVEGAKLKVKKPERKGMKKVGRSDLIEALSSGNEDSDEDDKENNQSNYMKMSQEEMQTIIQNMMKAEVSIRLQSLDGLHDDKNDDDDDDDAADVISSEDDVIDDDDEDDSKKKGKKNSRSKKSIKISDDDDDDFEDDDDEGGASNKRTKKRNKLLDAELSSSQEDDENEDGEKKKMKGGRKKKKGSDDEDFEIIDDDDSEVETKKKKRRKRQHSSDEASEDDKDDDDENDVDDNDEGGKKKKNKKKKKGKRRRIKTGSDSSANEQQDGSEEGNSSDDFKSPNHKRKRIRKILNNKKLSKTTLDAAKEEEERRKRIIDKQKLFNQVTVTDGDSATLCPVTTKLVLEEVKNKDKKKKKGKKDGDENDDDDDDDEDDDDDVGTKGAVEVYKKIICKLKPHQVEAVKFMWSCCYESLERTEKDVGSGCILAHCMGLGKTLSVIAFVHTILSNQRFTKQKTCLVLGPLNTILNWESEFENWLKGCPSIDVYELSTIKDNSSRAELLRNWHQDGGVMIMGYEMFRNLSQLSRIKNKKQKKVITESLLDPGPDLVVCDEGHILKNDATGLSKACNQIRTRRRVVLTGTPLQNNLVEYHCMVNFVKPNLLGTRKEFMNRFVNPICNGQCSDSTMRDVKIMKKRAHILHESLAGCVQRRDYSSLTKFLLPKFEYVIWIRLSKVQISLYERYLQRLSEGTEQLAGGPGRGSRIFTDYQNLMKIWTHPWVLKLDEIRQETKRMNNNYDSEDESFIDDSDLDSKSSKSDTPPGSDDDNDDDDENKNNAVTIADSDDDWKPRGKRLTRGAAAAQKKAATKAAKDKKNGLDEGGNGGVKEEGGDEVVKGWKTRSRGGAIDGEDKFFDDIVDETLAANNKVSNEWWAEFIKPDDQYRVDISGKLLVLAEVLRMCESIGDKVLLFSQSLLSLDIIEDFLAHWDKQDCEDVDKRIAGTMSWEKGIDYLRMDGSSNAQNRKENSALFNDPENIRARLFLISTRAGSLGINLVAANRVIIFDASWNPSHDIQSIFRVYRFGQTKPVYVYRLLAQGTMEEKIYERQVTKLSLSQRVVDEHQIERHFSAADLRELYTFRPDKLDDPNRKEQPTPVLPKDRLLAELITDKSEWIYHYLEHDSLLENKQDEELTEEERKAAWQEYEDEKKGLRPPPSVTSGMGGGQGSYGMSLQQLMSMGQAQMSQEHIAQRANELAVAIYRNDPTISQQELSARVAQCMAMEHQAAIKRQQELQMARLRQMEQHRHQREQQMLSLYQQQQQLLLNHGITPSTSRGNPTQPGFSGGFQGAGFSNSKAGTSGNRRMPPAASGGTIDLTDTPDNTSKNSKQTKR